MSAYVWNLLDVPIVSSKDQESENSTFMKQVCGIGPVWHTLSCPSLCVLTVRRAETPFAQTVRAMTVRLAVEASRAHEFECKFMHQLFMNELTLESLRNSILLNQCDGTVALCIIPNGMCPCSDLVQANLETPTSALIYPLSQFSLSKFIRKESALRHSSTYVCAPQMLMTQ